ncbi:hypothetical protein A9D60_16105 [Leisingera sp. JC1]|nr:hypothetical protein A9D60_16105 [Leisingera sp. JC1]
MLAAMSLVLASGANALTITNTRSDSVTVTFSSGSDSFEIALDPGESATEACGEGCLLKLADGTGQTFHPDDHVLIEEDGFATAE